MVSSKCHLGLDLSHSQDDYDSRFAEESLRSYLSAIINTASFHSQKGPDLSVRFCGHPIYVDEEPLEVCELRNDSIKLLVQYSRTSTIYLLATFPSLIHITPTHTCSFLWVKVNYLPFTAGDLYFTILKSLPSLLPNIRMISCHLCLMSSCLKHLSLIHI